MYRIFISHSWSHSSAYNKIERFLNNEEVSYYNHSIPKNDPVHTDGSTKQLIDAIDAKIKGCSCVIILAGIYSSYSKWINNEIKIAKKYKKPIIAVRLRGAQRVSRVVKDAATIMVGWKGSSVANAIREYAIK